MPDDEHPRTEPTDPPETTEATAAGGTGGRERAEDEGDRIARKVSQAVRRGTPIVSGFTAFVVTLDLILNAASPPWQKPLVFTGVVLVLIALLVSALRAKSGDEAMDERRRHRWFGAIASAGALFLVVGYLLHPAVDRIQDWMADCGDPVELTVLLPVDGAAGFQDAIAAFNRAYVDGDRCRRANVTAYSAPWPDVEQAMRLGWLPPGKDAAAGDRQPLRDVGPRPDFWIAESQTQVDLAADALRESEVRYEVFARNDAEPIGRTPLVLAVPDAVRADGFLDGERTTDRPLPELITELGDVYGTPVLRSDPAVATSGLLFLRTLYGQDGDGAGARIENRLADAAAEVGIALSPSDTGLLCDLSRRQGPNPTAAVLTTEAALARYNSGTALGDTCPLAVGSRSGLVPVYGEALGSLDYQAVGLDWHDDPWAERRAAVGDALEAWLAGEEDGWKPTAMGVRDVHYDGGEIEGDLDFDKDFTVEADPISAGEFTDLRADYGENRVPTDVLLAIDHSETMDERVGGGASRFDLAIEGVTTALGYLGAEDRVGLWTFPADGADSYRELLGIGPDPGEAAAELLAASEASQGVDLHQTVVDGIDALEAAGDGERISAMVVLTDGADRDTSQTTAAEVHARLDGSHANLYLIAVGDTSCRSAAFAALTENSRVTCLDAESEQITVTFDSLFNQLWSGR
ncbi:hypothetical protein K3N28_18805 [Glycomyces sp. TRM65418]|uniref:hypothetical protein n=1 Tax=Glycomyces sp. TRM65418 TaxID=2867006 RepID=UPI001CE5DC36|nr:hypothetical protein [Glycomyces sp. TRM65418]MCC3765114.1 hypothetical protein [Glycomyces sp. TRM65418]QZD54743.1 hypothetical protein K3N28_18715 [Glycomyces sp. TRM65418]